MGPDGFLWPPYGILWVPMGSYGFHRRSKKPTPRDSRSPSHHSSGSRRGRNPGKAPKRSRKSPPVLIDSRSPTPQWRLTPPPPQKPPPQWAEKKTVNAIIGQFVVTEDATPEDLGKLLNDTPVHVLVLFFAVAQGVYAGVSPHQVKVMAGDAVAVTAKFHGHWMPGAAVLVAKERFKSPNITDCIVATSGHYWCVDVRTQLRPDGTRQRSWATLDGCSGTGVRDPATVQCESTWTWC